MPVKSKKAKGKDSACKGFVLPFNFLLLPVLLCLFTFSFCLSISAQDDDFAPPPLRTVTKDERVKLSATSDVKNRTKLSLEMMAAHLTAAEQFNTNTDFDGVFRELGGFQGLLDNALEFLSHQNSESGKVLDNYKRLEIGLRTFTPRIETIRRDLPLRYEDYVHKLLFYVRDARSRAVDPLFSDKVVQIKNTK